jgi:hypothetical protein
MLTYKQCLELEDSTAFKTYGYRKLANHTYLFRRTSDMFAVRLHNTDIIDIYESGKYTLYTGGWETNTTKDRIHSFSPASIYTERGVWYLDIPRSEQPEIFEKMRNEGYTGEYQYNWPYSAFGVRKIAGGKFGVFIKSTKKIIEEFGTSEQAHNWRAQRIPFYDGVVVGSDGYVISPDTEKSRLQEQATVEVKAMVKQFIEGYIDDIIKNGLQEPGNGDCWPCLMKPAYRKPERGEECMGISHYFSHFKEKYYVPSMLANALKERYTHDVGAGFMWHNIKRYQEHGDRSGVSRCVTDMFIPFFKARRSAMVDYVLNTAPPSARGRKLESALKQLA